MPTPKKKQRKTVKRRRDRELNSTTPETFRRNLDIAILYQAIRQECEFTPYRALRTLQKNGYGYLSLRHLYDIAKHYIKYVE